MKKSIITTAIGLALLFTSCGDVFKGGWNINSTEGLTELNKEFAPEFGEKEFYEFEITAKDNLTSEFGSAKISYLEEGVDFSQKYALNYEGEKKIEDPVKASDAFQTKFFTKNKKGKMKLADLDFSQIEKNFLIGIEMLKEEFENFSLHQWTFEANNKNEISSEFTIEGTKIGESSHTDGRNIVTDYYQFNFTLDSKGELKLKEN